MMKGDRMRAIQVIGTGAAHDGIGGRAAVGMYLGAERLPDTSHADSVTDSAKLLAAFKRRTQQRYVDESVGPGLSAIEDACESAGGVLDADPWRTGLLLATEAGAVATRLQYLESYASRGGKSVSATLFSNCGYNIVGAMLARNRSIRGPVLTLGADERWGARLLATARRMFAARRADRLFVGRADGNSAVMLLLTPADSAHAGRSLVILPESTTAHVSVKQGDTLHCLPGEELLWRIADIWGGDATHACARDRQ